MAIDVRHYTLVFPEWFDSRAEAETPDKGYLPDVEVQVPGGQSYRLYFIDPIRLQQTLEEDTQAGRPYFSERGLVVVPEVTTASVHRAVEGLFLEGFFSQNQGSENGG